MFTRKRLAWLAVLAIVVGGGYLAVSHLVPEQPGDPEHFKPVTAEEKLLESYFTRLLAVEEKYLTHKETGLTAEEESEFESVIRATDALDWKSIERLAQEAKDKESKSSEAYVKVAKDTDSKAKSASGTVGSWLGGIYSRAFLEPVAQKSFNDYVPHAERVQFLAAAYDLPYDARYDFVKALLMSKKSDKARKVLLEILSKDKQQAVLPEMAFLAGLAGAADDAAFMQVFKDGGGDTKALQQVHDDRSKIDLLSPYFSWPSFNPADH